MPAHHRLHLDQPAHYQIKVQGRLTRSWAGYFADLQISVEGEDGWAITTLAGTLPDQAALYGLLQTLYSLGMPLLAVQLNQPAKEPAN